MTQAYLRQQYIQIGRNANFAVKYELCCKITSKAKALHYFKELKQLR